MRRILDIFESYIPKTNIPLHLWQLLSSFSHIGWSFHSIIQLSNLNKCINESPIHAAQEKQRI